MAALTCDLCGGKLVMGSGSVAVCESCGMEHSADRMKEKVQEIRGTVRADNTHMIENYLNMTKSAYIASNYKEAEDCANKVIETDQENYIAWNIKAKAAGWQTTTRDDRFSESITAWLTAMRNVDQAHKSELALDITSKLSSLAYAILKLHCGNFSSIRDKEHKNTAINMAKNMKSLVDMFVTNSGLGEFGFSMDLFCDGLARCLNTGAVEGSNAADEAFGPEKSDKSDWAFTHYVEEQDNCLALLEKALEYSSDDDLNFTIVKNYLAIAPTVRDACSYKFEATAYSSGYVVSKVLTDKAKEIRNKTIDNWTKKLDTYDPKKRCARCESSLFKGVEKKAI